MGVKTIVKKLVITILKPILKLIYFIKYKNIWRIKEELKKQNSPNSMLHFIYEDYFYRYGSWIGYNCDMDGIPCFPHYPIGIFISNNTRIGKNVVIFQHVTIGSDTLRDSDNKGSPVIGDNVYIGCGAKIIGGIKIGDNCRIGANAVVYKDMPPNSVAVQSPTRIIQKEKLDNRFYSLKDNGRWMYYDNGKWVDEHEDRG